MEDQNDLNLKIWMIITLIIFMMNEYSLRVPTVISYLENIFVYINKYIYIKI